MRSPAQLLDDAGIRYTIHEHVPVVTVGEILAALPFPAEEHVKTLAFDVHGSAGGPVTSSITLSASSWLSSCWLIVLRAVAAQATAVDGLFVGSRCYHSGNQLMKRQVADALLMRFTKNS